MYLALPEHAVVQVIARDPSDTRAAQELHLTEAGMGFFNYCMSVSQAFFEFLLAAEAPLMQSGQME